jgi:hypothetical protein
MNRAQPARASAFIAEMSERLINLRAQRLPAIALNTQI